MEKVSIIWCFKGENTKKGIYYDGNLSAHTLSVWLKNVGKGITPWLINDIAPFSQFDLVILSMPITGISLVNTLSPRSSLQLSLLCQPYNSCNSVLN